MVGLTWLLGKHLTGEESFVILGNDRMKKQVVETDGKINESV